MIVEFSFTLHNIGKSVATEATVYAAMFAQKRPGANFLKEPAERQSKLCSKDQPYSTNVSLFPDETKRFNIGLSIPRAELESNIIAPPPGVTNPKPQGKRISPVLVGCIDYDFPTAIKHHQTGFIYSIARLEPGSPGVPFWVIIGQPLPVERIRLDRWMFGGDNAD